MLLLIIDRSHALAARRTELWLAKAGKPGNCGSRLLVVSGPPPKY
jgi:hypothetical protein